MLCGTQRELSVRGTGRSEEWRQMECGKTDAMPTTVSGEALGVRRLSGPESGDGSDMSHAS